MKNCTASEEFEVTDRLGKIFSVLQTLPDSLKGSSKTPGRTWRLEDDKVVLITNPKFYKIRGISKESEGKQARKKTMRILKPRNQLHRDLLEHAGYDDLIASKALVTERRRLKEQRNRKSMKSRNARKPPMRRQEASLQGQEKDQATSKGMVDDDDEEEEIEEEEEEEEEEDMHGIDGDLDETD